MVDCALSEPRGSVYGIAIEIKDDEQKKNIFADLHNGESLSSCNKNTLRDWFPIGKNFYPLYWGKDINMGIRLYSHTKTLKSTGTLQLNNKKWSALTGKLIVYDVVPCFNYAENEKT